REAVLGGCGEGKSRSGLLPLALVHEALLGGALERFAVRADRLGCARVPLAFRHEARFRRPGERLAIFADGLAFAGPGSLCRRRSDGKRREQYRQHQSCHRPLSLAGDARACAKRHDALSGGKNTVASPPAQPRPGVSRRFSATSFARAGRTLSFPRQAASDRFRTGSAAASRTAFAASWAPCMILCPSSFV